MNDSRDSKNSQYSSESDERLAELCKKEDDAAFQELMRRHMSHIYNFSRQYVRTAEDAEDIAQDTFFKVWKNARTFKKGRAFKPWLFTIARNTALDFIKKKKAVVFSDLDDTENDLSFSDTLEDKEPSAHDLFESVENAAIIAEILEEIHPEHRSVLMLHYREEMTFDEIAVVVGKPMNTVKSWHRRALIKLRELLSHRKGGSARNNQY